MPHAKHLVLLAAVLALGALPALADGKGKGHGKGQGNRGGGWDEDWGQGRVARGCPPGLAKKNPPCIPPGQAKKYAPEIHRPHIYGRGDYLPDDAVYLRDPRYHGLPDGTYYVDDGYVYRVDPETLEIMALIGLVDRLLN